MGTYALHVGGGWARVWVHALRIMAWPAVCRRGRALS